MDISELQLKINKNSAVNDLKTVESQLDKTGKAADGLIETLKDIGLTVGFGKLIKDSLQLNSQFTSLSSKFKSIFSDGFDTKVFSELKSELTLSDTALKNILSTTGQFAKGLNQSSQYIKSFSTDLTRAAADYAAYQGKTSAADANEYARKFAKATLGEVGELKDIGIIIDTSSESFKKAVAQMSELTGTTEAQARQMVIQKELMEQVKVASGAASQKINDGWSQLNKLFDQFKEILSEVGSIFSKVLAPILGVLNGILEIPFVKSTIAWGIAIGVVVVGFVSLKKTLNALTDSFNAFRIGKDNMDLIRKSSGEYKKIMEKLVPLQKQFMKYFQSIDGVKWSMRPYAERLKLTQGSADYQSNVVPLENDLKRVQHSIKGLGYDIVSLIPGMQGVSWELKNYAKALLLSNDYLKTSTIVTLAQAAAEKILALSRMNLKSGGEIISTLFGNISKTFKKLSLGFAAFWTKLAAGATGLAAVKTVLLTLGAAALKVVAVVGAVVAVFVAAFDSIKAITNLFQGKNYWEGTIGGWVGDKIGWKLGNGDEAEKTSKKLDEQFKILRQQRATWNSLMKELDDIKFGDSLKNLNLDQELTKLQDRRRQIEQSLQSQQSLINDYVKRTQDLSITQEERNKAADLRNEAQSKYNQLLREKVSLDDRIASKQKEINNVAKQYAKDIADTVKRMNTALQSFSFGRKDGIFQNLAEQAKQTALYNRSLVIQEKLRKLSRSEDLDSLKDRKELTSELFDVTKESLTYQMDALNKQRLAAIENLKAMQALVNESMKLKSTLQTGVDANSQDAVRLQSRQLDLSAKNLAPLVEQQGKIKDIEEQMLQKQSSSETILRKVGQDLTSILKKIAEGSTGRSVKLDVVEVKY